MSKKQYCQSLVNMFKTCPVCGKVFPVYNQSEYLLKKRIPGSKPVYFCKYSCKKLYEQQRKQSRKALAGK